MQETNWFVAHPEVMRYILQHEQAQELIGRMCAAPPVIQYEERDEIIHTDEHPFCGDGDCPCHGEQTWEQIDYQTEYLEQPFNDGLLTVPEYHRLFWNEQL